MSSLFNERVKALKSDYHTLTSFLKSRYNLDFDRLGNERQDKSLKIKREAGLITDFNGSFKGDIIDFIAFKENLSLKQALGVFASFAGLDLRDDLQEPLNKAPLKQGFKKLWAVKSAISKRLRPHRNDEIAKSQALKDIVAFEALQKKALSLKANFNFKDDAFQQALSACFFKDFRLLMHLCKLNFLSASEFNRVLEYFAFDEINQSVIIMLKDEKSVKSIATHKRLFNEKLVKWHKEKASSAKFINLIKAKEKPFLKEYCFIFSGMKENIISELLGLNALCFQCDSVMKNISTHEQASELLNFIKGKRVFLVVENDESSFNAGLEFLHALKALNALEMGYCVFCFDEVLRADFIDFLEYLFKGLRLRFEKDSQGFTSFYNFLESQFKSAFLDEAQKYIKVST